MKKLPISPSFPSDLLKSWFLATRRDLPWRQNPAPYAVWVSEVMLQQTQVSVVIPYFMRWIDRFPTVRSLAEASLDEVIKLWEGLGYYSRARSLHKAARHIVEHHHGDLPSSREALEKIPGLGPYTVGAILSFAFGQKAAAVDGNVVRVLARFAAIQEEVSSTAFKKWIWSYAENLLPEVEPWLIVEGLIELGATVCTRQPKCFVCPLSSSCLGLKTGVADLLPIKKTKMPVTQLNRQVAIIRHQGMGGEFFLLCRGKQGSVMADLYEFPYLEGEDFSHLEIFLSRTLQLSVRHVENGPRVQHSFTRYRATLYPSVWESAKKSEVEGFEWVEFSNLEQLPFSSGHRKIMNQLKDRYAHSTY